MLAVSSHHHLLHAVGNSFQEDLLHSFSRDQGGNDRPTVPWILLTWWVVFACHQEPPFVTMTFERWQWLLQWHQPAPSSAVSASRLVPKVFHGHSFPFIPWVGALVLHNVASRTSLLFLGTVLSLFLLACVPVLLYQTPQLQCFCSGVHCMKLQSHLPVALSSNYQMLLCTAN